MKKQYVLGFGAYYEGPESSQKGAWEALNKSLDKYFQNRGWENLIYFIDQKHPLRELCSVKEGDVTTYLIVLIDLEKNQKKNNEIKTDQRKLAF